MYFNDSYIEMALSGSDTDLIAAKRPMAFVAATILAGMYIGFGVLLSFTVGGMFAGAPFAKLLMGCTFGIALSLVVICGAELFTGNNMKLLAARMEDLISTKDMILLWVTCWLGNWVGASFLTYLFQWTGLDAGTTFTTIANAAVVKVAADPGMLFARGILCNILVCAAVWSSMRTNSDSAKLIMTFWCLLAFFTTGFEHSVANMTLLNLAVLSGVITWSQLAYNLLIVTIGNIVGGVILAIAYNLMSKSKMIVGD